MSRRLRTAQGRFSPRGRVWVTLSVTLALAALLLLVIGATSGVAGQALQAGSATVYVDPGEQSLSRCDTFSVAISVRDLPEPVAGYEFTLRFNPDVVTATNVLEVHFDEEVEVLSETRIEEDRVRFFALALGGEGQEGDGVLAVVAMEAVGLGLSDLVLTSVVLSNSEGEAIATTVEHGTVEGTKEAVGFEFDPIASPQVAGQPFDVTITALNEDGGRAVGFSRMATLGDSTATLSPTEVTFAAGQAVFSATITGTHAGITVTAAGTNACGVPVQGESDPFDVEPDMENPVGLSIDPEEVTLTAGECVTFTLTGEDPYGNLFDATRLEETTFVIDEGAGGEWTANVYCSEFAGEWTVTGEYMGESADALVIVELDFENPVGVTIEPAEATVTAGGSVTYTLTAEDGFGNPWDITGQADFAIDAAAGGEFDESVYTSELAGGWTVTGSWEGLEATAALTVEPDVDNPEAVTIEPAEATVTAGGSLTYTLTAEDGFGNLWDVTDEADFAIDAVAGGEFSANVYTSEFAGEWTVTGSWEGLEDTATLTVDPDVENPVAVTIEPAEATVMAGESVTYTLRAEDGFGNTWDVTGEAEFDIDTGAGGEFVGNVYTSELAGEWTVTGSWAELEDAATLTVEPEPVEEFLIFLPILAKNFGP